LAAGASGPASWLPIGKDGTSGDRTLRDTKRNHAERAHGPVKLGAATLDKLIEEVTVGCHSGSGQRWGRYTMIEHNPELPLRTQVVGVDVAVERVALSWQPCNPRN
jgi:hypothetical protein